MIAGVYLKKINWKEKALKPCYIVRSLVVPCSSHFSSVNKCFANLDQRALVHCRDEVATVLIISFL